VRPRAGLGGKRPSDQAETEGFRGQDGGIGETVKPIEKCAIEGCGLRVGYDFGESGICWLHAEKQGLPAHRQWRQEHAEFMRTFASEFGRAATKRDNYGV
jgi:hypothetical protein